jgi:hypothetical protein
MPGLKAPLRLRFCNCQLHFHCILFHLFPNNEVLCVRIFLSLVGNTRSEMEPYQSVLRLHTCRTLCSAAQAGLSNRKMLHIQNFMTVIDELHSQPLEIEILVNSLTLWGVHCPHNWRKQSASLWICYALGSFCTIRAVKWFYAVMIPAV